MNTPLKQSALISQLNASLADAIPAGTRVDDWGLFHRTVKMAVEPFLIPGLKAVTWGINADGQSFHENPVYVLDIFGFAPDKRQKNLGNRGKFTSPPVMEAKFPFADTVEEAVFLARDRWRREGIKRLQASIEGHKNEVAEWEALLERRTEEANAEYRAFYSAMKDRTVRHAEAIMLAVAKRWDLDVEEVKRDVQTCHAGPYGPSFKKIVTDLFKYPFTDDEAECLRQWTEDVFDLPAAYNPHA